jgi:hypothetical protein
VDLNGWTDNPPKVGKCLLKPSLRVLWRKDVVCAQLLMGTREINELSTACHCPVPAHSRLNLSPAGTSAIPFLDGPLRRPGETPPALASRQD